MAEALPGDVAALRAEQSRWMAQIAAGGAAAEIAMKAVFDAYDRRTVGRLMARFRLTQDEAEDVWQEALIDLWKRADAFRPGADLAPWLNTLVNHRALKLLDSAWHRQRTGLGDADGAEPGVDANDDAPGAAEPMAVDGAEPGDRPASAQDPTRNLDADTCTDEGLDRFEQQHPVDARWLFARELEGRDIPSLAAEMGRSEVATRQRLHVLRNRLRPFLQHCVELLAAS